MAINFPFSTVFSVSHEFCSTDIPHFTMLCFTAFHRCYIFYKLKAFGNYVLSKFNGIIFPTAFSLYVSVLHFDNSHNISNFFLSIIFVMVICDGDL